MARWVPGDEPHPIDRATGRAVRLHLRNPALLLVTVAGGATVFTYAATFSYVAFRLEGHPFDLSTRAVGLVFAVWAVGLLGAARRPPRRAGRAAAPAAGVRRARPRRLPAGAQRNAAGAGAGARADGAGPVRDADAVPAAGAAQRHPQPRRRGDGVPHGVLRRRGARRLPAGRGLGLRRLGRRAAGLARLRSASRCWPVWCCGAASRGRQGCGRRPGSRRGGGVASGPPRGGYCRHAPRTRGQEPSAHAALRPPRHPPPRAARADGRRLDAAGARRRGQLAPAASAASASPA